MYFFHYTVFFSTADLNGDDLLINWSNTDNAGGTRSGQETLHRVLGKTDSDTISVVENDAVGVDSIYGGKLFGKVYKINEKDIIVACRNAGDEVEEGSILYLIIDGKKIEMKVILSMQSVIKCRLADKTKTTIDEIETEMPVYK